MSHLLPGRSLPRRVVALVAAYAIVLQTVLAAALSLQAIQPADAANVICHTASSLAPATDEGNDTGQGRRGDHCTLCATVSPPLPERPAVAQAVPHPTQRVTAGKPRPVQLSRDIRSHPGKPRDPPAAA